MPREATAAHSLATVRDQVVELYQDLEHEVESQAHNPKTHSSDWKLECGKKSGVMPLSA